MKLIWLDLETTGLNPQADCILEVFAAEADLTMFGALSRLYHAVVQLPPERTEDTLSEWIRETHGASGLLDEVRASNTSIEDVERELLKRFGSDPNLPRDEKPVLAGSTVHFDLNFVRVHMPTFAATLSHRCYDVSAIQLFARSLGMPPLPRAEAHRALADVLESVQNTVKIREWFMKRRTP